MGKLVEIISEGITKFGGEIVAGILLMIALWMFPGLKRLFGRESASEREQRIQRELEVQRQKEEKLREELRRKDEALRQAKAQKTDEAIRRTDIYRQKDEPTDQEAQNALGDEYYAAKDYEQAVKWYSKAAEQGHVLAQFNLGRMYEYGLGIPEDLNEARKWYKKAADQRLSPAIQALERLKQ